jgi:hypothetical protein
MDTSFVKSLQKRAICVLIVKQQSYQISENPGGLQIRHVVLACLLKEY